MIMLMMMMVMIDDYDDDNDDDDEHGDKQGPTQDTSNPILLTRAHLRHLQPHMP